MERLQLTSGGKRSYWEIVIYCCFIDKWKSSWHLVDILDWLPGYRNSFEFLSGWCILDLINSDQRKRIFHLYIIGIIGIYYYWYKIGIILNIRGTFSVFLVFSIVRIPRVSSCKEPLGSISRSPLRTSHGTSPHHGKFWTNKKSVWWLAWLLCTCGPARWGERRSRRRAIFWPDLGQHCFPVTGDSRSKPASIQRHSWSDEIGPRTHCSILSWEIYLLNVHFYLNISLLFFLVFPSLAVYSTGIYFAFLPQM